MLQAFYFRFYRLTHCEWLSIILSNLAYTIYFCKYILERVLYRRRIMQSNKDEALEHIKSLHDDIRIIPQYGMAEMDESLDLSIIVPVYNYAELIEANINSILNQKTQYTYQLILVDDGSTDGAQDILNRYRQYPNVKVIFQKNQGIAGARNTGISNATGKYLMFVDCDDIVEDNLVETLMTKAYKDNCDIVMCAHNRFKQKNGEIYEVIPNIYPNHNLQNLAQSAKILNYAGLPWCKVYKRELWEQVRYFPGLWFEDTIIQGLIFTQCNKFAYDPTICYQYRWYENNFSHIQGKSQNPKNIDMYWLLCRILERYEELQLPRDEKYETMLLKHLSAYYLPKISGLEEETVDMLFVLACGLYEKYGIQENCKLPYMLQITKKALQQGDINLWKIASKYQK